MSCDNFKLIYVSKYIMTMLISGYKQMTYVE